VLNPTSKLSSNWVVQLILEFVDVDLEWRYAENYNDVERIKYTTHATTP